MTAMTTDPTGRVFLSYRRSCARKHGDEEALRLQRALNDRGVPTWRDIENLANEPLEDALRREIRKPGTSGAVLLVTPEVAESETIRSIEVPELCRRHDSCEDFFVVPVLIGVDYDDVDEVLGLDGSPHGLGSWNLHNAKCDVLGEENALMVADKVLLRRVGILNGLSSGSPFSVGLYSRRKPPGSGMGISHDFTRHFQGRMALDNAYSVMEDGLLASARTVLSVASRPVIEGEGMAASPLGTLFGAVYSPRAGFKVRWLQQLEGHETERWSHELPQADYSLNVETVQGDRASSDIVLAVGVSARIKTAVAEAMSKLSISARMTVYVEPEPGPLDQGVSMSPGEGVAVAMQSVGAARGVKDQCGLERATLHIFQACPLALSVLIGQKLNSFSECVLYEHDPERNPSYLRVHKFNPSGYTYTPKVLDFN